jgi:hypothetical protein
MQINLLIDNDFILVGWIQDMRRVPPVYQIYNMTNDHILFPHLPILFPFFVFLFQLYFAPLQILENLPLFLYHVKICGFDNNVQIKIEDYLTKGLYYLKHGSIKRRLTFHQM